MLRTAYYKLTDPTVAAALHALETCGRAAGDLAQNPGLAAAALRPARSALEKASAPSQGGQVAGRALDLLLRYEKFCAGLALHAHAPDARLLQALALFQRICRGAPGLVSLRRSEALSETRALCASAGALLQAACAEADEAPSTFPEKLKYSSIYSDLSGIFSSLEKCAEALYAR